MAGRRTTRCSRARWPAPKPHGLAHEVLTGAEVNARFPGYRMPGAYRFVLQPRGGLIASERAIVAHVRLAQAAGAAIQARERVLGLGGRRRSATA